MGKNLYELFQENPVIASIKDDRDLEAVLNSDCDIVFVLYGNILNIIKIIHKIKCSGKMAFVNIDLIDGFSNGGIVLKYLKKFTKADGILSSKAYMIQLAKSHGFFTVHRFYLVDSFSFQNIKKQLQISQPDCIEILPGCVPKVISWVMERIHIPLIAGGLVCEKDEVIAALNAGAIAISSTSSTVWSM